MARRKTSTLLTILALLAACVAACNLSATPTLTATAQPTPTATVQPTSVQVPTATPQMTAGPTPSPTPISALSPGWTKYTAADGLASGQILQIVTAPNGALWSLSAGGISQLAGDNWITHTLDQRLWLAPGPIGIAASDDALWIADGTLDAKGVFRFDGETWTLYTTAEGLADNHVTSIAVATDGDLWFGTINGISRFDGEAWTTYTTDDGLVSNLIEFVVAAPDGNIATFTDREFSYFDGATWHTVIELEGVTNWGTSILLAPDRTLWFGDADGVHHLDAETVTHYTVEDGLPDNMVTSLAMTPNGALWIGTFSNGISCFDGETWTTYTFPGGLLGNSVESMATTPDGALWIATMSGLWRYMPEPQTEHVTGITF